MKKPSSCEKFESQIKFCATYKSAYVIYEWPLSDLIESTDNHADRLFHIAHFAMYCTNDASTAQALTNSLHLAQILEKELVPACLKLYFSHDDFGAKIQLRNLRSLWRTEVESIEANILDIVDPTAFCVIVEAEARRVASAVKKDQYR